MNYPPPPAPPSGPGGFPPPGQPPYAQTWAAPAGPPPPRRSRTGLTIALLAVGLVLVLGVIGVVALVVRGDDSGDSASAAGDAHEMSCAVYRDVVLNGEVWAATDLDPDKLQEMYDAALADIADDEVEALVEEEATVVVSYYRALHEWKQSLEDALAQGQYPDTAIPADITSQQGEIPASQAAVVEACQDVLPAGNDKPIPKITAPPLNTPSWMDE